MKKFLLACGFLVGVAFILLAFFAPLFSPVLEQGQGRGWLGFAGGIIIWSCGAAFIEEK